MPLSYRAHALVAARIAIPNTRARASQVAGGLALSARAARYWRLIFVDTLHPPCPLRACVRPLTHHQCNWSQRPRCNVMRTRRPTARPTQLRFSRSTEMKILTPRTPMQGHAATAFRTPSRQAVASRRADASAMSPLFPRFDASQSCARQQPRSCVNRCQRFYTAVYVRRDISVAFATQLTTTSTLAKHH